MVRKFFQGIQIKSYADFSAKKLNQISLEAFFPCLESYECLCPAGRTGRSCEVTIDLCQSSPCFGAATCLPTLAGSRCLCPPSYGGKFCQTGTVYTHYTGSQPATADNSSNIKVELRILGTIFRRCIL